MPSKKITITLILCLAGITSVWLIEKSRTQSLKDEILKNSVSVISNKSEEFNTSTEWEKILTSLDKKSQDYEDLTKNNEEAFDDTTLTAQMSRDFMSQYLLLKKGGREITQEDIDKIAENTLASPQYKGLIGAVYIYKNLKIVKDTATSLRKYKSEINSIIKKRSTEANDNPIISVSGALGSNNSSAIGKLNIFIKATKGFINDSLTTEVPSSAVTVHLNLVNSASNILATTEALKDTDNDPVKAMIAVKEYNNYIITLQQRVEELNSYLSSIR